MDIYNRQIVVYAAGKHKDAKLVQKVFGTVKASLNDITIFHTDRDNEFKNNLIAETLEALIFNVLLVKKAALTITLLRKLHLKL